MPQFRKRPVVIEAMQFTEETKDQVFNFVTCNRCPVWNGYGDLALKIQTPEGTMIAQLGDWVIKGVTGEFYPCRDDIFRATYDLT